MTQNQQPIPEAAPRDLFDRKLGSLVGVPGVLHTKPTTIRVTTPLVGDSQAFIVQTYRQRDENDEKVVARDHVFVEYVDGSQHVRLYLPPEVAACIARQRDAMTSRSRKRGAQAAADDRKARGIKPAFLKKRKGE